LFFGIIES